MKSLARPWLLICALALCAVAGCGTGEYRPASDGSASGAADKLLRDSPETADAAVLAVIDDLKQNRLEGLWDFLPGSFQKDLNDLAQSFAERMDPQVWNSTFAVLRKLAK
ncbi:MAG TPA: hypothetical protein VKU82_08705, partial [Planctomycetaceae bacterium]|nr:hypothetical protein [Planctomycetaceae bacterium]